jgi:hypothetical protein
LLEEEVSSKEWLRESTIVDVGCDKRCKRASQNLEALEKGVYRKPLGEGRTLVELFVQSIEMCRVLEVNPSQKQLPSNRSGDYVMPIMGCRAVVAVSFNTSPAGWQTFAQNGKRELKEFKIGWEYALTDL